MSHHEVLDGIAGFDQHRGTKVAGHRGYFLLNHGVDFNLALIRYGLDFLESKGSALSLFPLKVSDISKDSIRSGRRSL